jgi:hypothetical protein
MTGFKPGSFVPEVDSITSLSRYNGMTFFSMKKAFQVSKLQFENSLKKGIRTFPKVAQAFRKSPKLSESRPSFLKSYEKKSDRFPNIRGKHQ